MSEFRDLQKRAGSKPCEARATVDGKCYLDPDAASELLYSDMAKVIRNTKVNKSTGLLQFDDRNRVEYCAEFSTDYIGPSRKQAVEVYERCKISDEVIGEKCCKISDEEIGEKIGEKIGKFLLVCREIGGHVFWPAHEIGRAWTINQARGFSKGINDRIDLTLAELKNYLEGGASPLYAQGLYNAFERYEGFFDQIDKIENGVEGRFNSFISYMHLKMFVIQFGPYSGMVKDLNTDLNSEEEKPISKNSDRKINEVYIKRCTHLIQMRTEELLNPELEEPPAPTT